MNDLKGNYQAIELQQLFVKLERDEHILKILKVPNRFKTIDFVEGLVPDELPPEPEDGCYHIELLPAFDKYYLKIQYEPEYQEFTGKKPQVPIEDPATESVLRKDIFATPTYSAKSRQIADQFSPENHQFVLMVLKKIISFAEFSPDGEVHYKLQSPFGQEIIKERSLLKKFESQGLFKHLGEDGVFGIATLGNLNTKLIKEVVSRLEEREAGVITSDESEDTKKKYNQIIQDLRKPDQSSELKERYNKILGEIRSKSKKLDASQQRDTQTPISPSDDKVLECGLLKINLDQSTIQFKESMPVEISTGVNTIKFLIILMENKRVVEYIEIAQKLKLNCYHDGVENKDVAREVQFLRRDLGDFLVKIGMNKKEVQEMFISKKNVGYKLRCSN